MSKGVPFTSASAPRQGRRKGAKNRLSAQMLKALAAFMDDFAKHGAEAIKLMRVEKTADYVRLGIDVSSRFMIAEETGKLTNNIPAVITVHWLSSPPTDAPPARVGHSAPLLELQADTSEPDDVLN